MCSLRLVLEVGWFRSRGDDGFRGMLDFEVRVNIYLTCRWATAKAKREKATPECWLAGFTTESSASRN
jgi:hypothetical protein